VPPFRLPVLDDRQRRAGSGAHAVTDFRFSGRGLLLELAGGALALAAPSVGGLDADQGADTDLHHVGAFATGPKFVEQRHADAVRFAKLGDAIGAAVALLGRSTSLRLAPSGDTGGLRLFTQPSLLGKGRVQLSREVGGRGRGFFFSEVVFTSFVGSAAAASAGANTAVVSSKCAFVMSGLSDE
jgi:hypothetical protein